MLSDRSIYFVVSMRGVAICSKVKKSCRISYVYWQWYLGHKEIARPALVLRVKRVA